MAIGLSVCTVSINNIPVAIIPNSLKFKLGRGEIKTRFASVGGGAGTTVHTEDAEAKVSMVKFEVYVTPENISLFEDIKSRIGANYVSITQLGQAPITMESMSVVNDPDWEASADGKAEIELQGNPAGSL